MHVKGIDKVINKIFLLRKVGPSSLLLQYLIFAILSLLVAMRFVFFGLKGWPGLHWDASLYATPVINVAKGLGWKFGNYAPLLVSHPDLNYDFHGFLHVFFFGQILKSADWASFFFYCGLTNAVTFLVWAWIFYTTFEGKSPIKRVFAALFFGLIAGGVALGTQGRPEHLVVLLSSIPVISYKILKKGTGFNLSLAMITGIFFCFSPTSGVIMGAVLILWLGLNDEDKSALLLLYKIAVYGCISVGVIFFLRSAIGETSFADWLLASRGHAKASQCAFKASYWWGASLDAPFWEIFLWMTYFLIFAELTLRKAFTSLFLCSVMAIYLYLGPTLVDYGYVVFYPLICLFLLRFDLKLYRYCNGLISRKRISIILAIMAIAYTGFFCRKCLLFELYQYQGVKFESTRDEVLQIIGNEKKIGGAVAFHSNAMPSLISVGEVGVDYIAFMPTKTKDEGWNYVLSKYEDLYGRRVNYLICPQAYRGVPHENLYLGNRKFVLVKDGWRRDRPKFFFVPLGGPWPGYQYALYKRE